MSTYGLVLHLGDGDATVYVSFDIEWDGDGDFEVNFDTIDVMYKDVKINDTLDPNDWASLDKQIMDKWYLIEEQMEDNRNDYW